MIADPVLRWIVTLLFVFSAAVCVRAILAARRDATVSGAASRAGMVSHALHALMAIAMVVMAWPRGAELPPRAPMVFFFAAALWFVAVTVRTASHRGAGVYHSLMMLAMAWMYATMGGLSLRRAPAPAVADAGMAGHGGHSGHAGHAGHSGHAGSATAGAAPLDWVGALNWLCALGFGAAAVFWLSRLVADRFASSGSRSGSAVGTLCQLAMAAGMAIMFAVTL